METNARVDGGSVAADKPVSGRCTCARCRTRGLMGPVMLITIGGLFLLQQYTRYSFGDLWPVILIVAGLVKVAESVVPSAHHRTSSGMGE